MTNQAPPEGIASDSHQTGDDHRLWLHATFERLERPLIAYAMRLLGGDVEVARDCVQESFLRLCSASQSHVEGHVDAWLFKTCRNRAMDHHRQEARMIIDSDSSALATVTASAAEPAGYLAQREEREHLHDKARPGTFLQTDRGNYRDERFARRRRLARGSNQAANRHGMFQPPSPILVQPQALNAGPPSPRLTPSRRRQLNTPIRHHLPTHPNQHVHFNR